MYVIWRVDDVREPTFDSLDEAVAEASRIIADNEREKVCVLKLLRRVKKRKPRVDVEIEVVS